MNACLSLPFLNQMVSSAVSAMDALEAEERALKFQLLKVHITEIN
jgi:hypothetical protein